MASPPPDDRPPTAPGRIRIVGLGASAGGLAALEEFLANVPASSGLAYVVVQHLDPTHKAMLSELLQRATAMPVREVTAPTHVEPDAVYVIPPNSELTAADGVLHLALPAQPRGQRLPIDVLFGSLARDQGEGAIGVVLSGMGSDGTLGLQSIKALGGLTLAQAPESAQFDSMPRSAIGAGCVDIVAPPAALPERILRVAGAQSALSPARAAAAPDPTDAHAFSSIIALLREHGRHDLSLYKPTTLTRRIGRRMGVHRLDTMAAYEALLRANPQEIELLFKEMLIGVTSFFRDPEVWVALKDEVLPALLARASAGGRLRAWVAGCSTGEEAYTLAMVFAEVVAGWPNPDPPALQIFATDLSADAIAVARRAVYPATIAADLPPDKLARFFRPEGEGFIVDKGIREMVLFAQHDVILDPPFTRLDLLSCRNLMIYFNAELQRRLMPLFHYCLRPGGILLLGSSETVGRSQTLFTALEGKSRFFRRREPVANVAAVEFPVNRRSKTRRATQEPQVSPSTDHAVNLQSLVEQIVLHEFAPAALLVNEQGDIVHISGRTGKYLEPAAGKANWNIHVMARPGIRSQLVAALRESVRDRKTVQLHGLRIEDDSQRAVDVTVQALQQPEALAGMVLIVFRDLAAAPGGRAKRRNAAATDDGAMADELARSREEVRALRQEMQASQEELQATNEELQSTNEELQSANEELTTSKEEAQSMNEELQTINAELQSKFDDLALAQSDMQNLLNSTDIATLFLDNKLNVRRYTERMVRIVRLREGDIGRPLSELATTLIYPDLLQDAMETLRTLVFTEKQIATTDGLWFSVRIMPYRTLANVIQGVVITFMDITATKQLESRLRER